MWKSGTGRYMKELIIFSFREEELRIFSPKNRGFSQIQILAPIVVEEKELF